MTAAVMMLEPTTAADAPEPHLEPELIPIKCGNGQCKAVIAMSSANNRMLVFLKPLCFIWRKTPLQCPACGRFMVWQPSEKVIE